MSALQLRGHCQCCGRQQAVLKGHVAQHGYEVKDGYFQGVCTGHRHPPIEQARDEADRVIASVRRDAQFQRDQAERLRTGKARPLMVSGPWDSKALEYTKIPFAEASRFAQDQAVAAAIQKMTQRAAHAYRWADDHQLLVDLFHGQPLIEVHKPEAPPPILIGERRMLPKGRVATVRGVGHGGKVRWCDEKGFLGTSTTRAWRGFATA